MGFCIHRQVMTSRMSFHFVIAFAMRLLVLEHEIGVSVPWSNLLLLLLAGGGVGSLEQIVVRRAGGGVCGLLFGATCCSRCWRAAAGSFKRLVAPSGGGVVAQALWINLLVQVLVRGGCAGKAWGRVSRATCSSRCDKITTSTSAFQSRSSCANRL